MKATDISARLHGVSEGRNLKSILVQYEMLKSGTGFRQALTVSIQNYYTNVLRAKIMPINYHVDTKRIGLL
jgi:hypothetical protein